jgi:hypothetical protein
MVQNIYRIIVMYNEYLQLNNIQLIINKYYNCEIILLQDVSYMIIHNLYLLLSKNQYPAPSPDIHI